MAEPNSGAASPWFDWWRLTEEQLVAYCVEDQYRASGPGGQHRNKTDSAVRLRHLPSGIVATGEESRSQHDNRRTARKRLRAALAFGLRQRVDLTEPAPPWIGSVISNGKIIVGQKNPDCLRFYAWLLDVLDAACGQLSTVAEKIGTSTAQIAKFFAQNDDAWQAVNQLRQRHGQKLLRMPD